MMKTYKRKNPLATKEEALEFLLGEPPDIDVDTVANISVATTVAKFALDVHKLDGV